MLNRRRVGKRFQGRVDGWGLLRVVMRCWWKFWCLFRLIVKLNILKLYYVDILKFSIWTWPKNLLSWAAVNTAVRLYSINSNLIMIERGKTLLRLLLLSWWWISIRRQVLLSTDISFSELASISLTFTLFLWFSQYWASKGLSTPRLLRWRGHLLHDFHLLMLQIILLYQFM